MRRPLSVECPGAFRACRLQRQCAPAVVPRRGQPPTPNRRIGSVVHTARLGVVLLPIVRWPRGNRAEILARMQLRTGRIANPSYSWRCDDPSARDVGIAHAHGISRTTSRRRCERQACVRTHARPAWSPRGPMPSRDGTVAIYELALETHPPVAPNSEMSHETETKADVHRQGSGHLNLSVGDCQNVRIHVVARPDSAFSACHPGERVAEDFCQGLTTGNRCRLQERFGADVKPRGSGPFHSRRTGDSGSVDRGLS